MDNNITGLLVFGIYGAVVLVTILITIGLCVFTKYIRKRKFEKYKNFYPEYFAEIERHNSELDKSCALWNDEIAPRHRKIDCLEESKRYLPSKEVEKVNEEIELLKSEAFEYEKIYRKDDADERSKNHQEAMKRIIIEKNVPKEVLEITGYGEDRENDDY